VPLDRELVDELLHHSDAIRYVPQADTQEHSLEIQLPFLQVMLKDFRLTPIVMGNQSLENCQDLAAAISQACQGSRVLLVASSDLSIFTPMMKPAGWIRSSWIILGPMIRKGWMIHCAAGIVKLAVAVPSSPSYWLLASWALPK